MPTIYVTTPRETAPDLAATLVEERLVACVNRVPIDSTYRWEGEVIHDGETLLLAKTTQEKYEAAVDRIEELHPHDVPCIERFDEVDMLDSFGVWLKDSVE